VLLCASKCKWRWSTPLHIRQDPFFIVFYKFASLASPLVGIHVRKQSKNETKNNREIITNWAHTRRIRNEPHCCVSVGLEKMETFVAWAANFAALTAALRPPLGGLGGRSPRSLVRGFGGCQPPQHKERAMSIWYSVSILWKEVSFKKFGSHLVHNGFNQFHMQNRYEQKQMPLSTLPTCFEGPRSRKLRLRDPVWENSV